MNESAVEHRVKIEWQPVGLGVQRGRMEEPPGWLFVKETSDGGAALCFVRDLVQSTPLHDPEKCHVCQGIANA